MSGGPRIWYSYDEKLNPTGLFGNPSPDPAHVALKDIIAGRCGLDESNDSGIASDMCPP